MATTNHTQLDESIAGLFQDLFQEGGRFADLAKVPVPDMTQAQLQAIAAVCRGISDELRRYAVERAKAQLKGPQTRAELAEEIAKEGPLENMSDEKLLELEAKYRERGEEHYEHARDLQRFAAQMEAPRDKKPN